ncbi:MAG: PP2C family protein-serine/threonine phosphatase [Ignavibacteriales bacterium]
MIEPKIFYRKLDFILDRIGRERSGKDFLFTIVKELENTFYSDLRLCKGRVYEEYEEYFALIYPDPSQAEHMTERLPVDSPGVQAVIKHKTYIYDSNSNSIDIKINGGKEYSIPAALTVSSSEYRWIIVFELKSGWIREEVGFCLNAVRSALNYRLYSESLKNEMTQAANIQQSLLPSFIPKIPGYDIACSSKPAEIVGGDLYDFYCLEDSRFGICLGDASGHGMPAALLVRDVVTGLRMGIDEDAYNSPRRKPFQNSLRVQKLKQIDSVNILKRLNRVIYKSTYSTRFVSLFYAEFDKSGKFFFVNAGHPSPILVKHNRVEELNSTGPIFGALPEVKLNSHDAEISSGDVMVLFSDGIFERQNSRNEEFGLPRLKELILMYRHKTAQELLNIIFGLVQEFGKSPRWEDDASLMIIKKL